MLVPCSLWTIALSTVIIVFPLELGAHIVAIYQVVLPIERVAYARCWDFTRTHVREEWCAYSRDLNIVGWSLRMGTNAIGTAMIAYKAWCVVAPPRVSPTLTHASLLGDIAD